LIACLNDCGLASLITEEDINDRTKSDAFTKLFAIVQSTWLVVQSIARAERGLAISELELATMAFVFCALVMYILWWEKPFDVERRHVVACLVKSEHMLHSNDVQWGEQDRVTDLSFTDFLHLALENDLVDGAIGNDWPSVALYMSGMVFSAIHLVAWNWRFPSPLVRALWRWFAMTAFITSCLPFFVFILGYLVNLIDRWISGNKLFDTIAENILGIFSIIMLVGYIVSRLVILVLTFYCFTSMPASVYEKVEWTGFIPHFS
jgi:hypothetical protein